jgi:hypothetical protein
VPFGAIVAESVFARGVSKMSFDGMSVVAILIVLIIGYTLGRVWTQPAKLVGLP